MKGPPSAPPAALPSPPPAFDAIRVSYDAVDMLPLRRIPPRPHHLLSCPSHCGSSFRSLAFLFVQGVVAWGIGLVLLTCVVLCLLLLPLCGLGVLVFRLIFRLQLVAFCAKCDAAIVNFVASDYDPIQIDTSAAVLPLLPTDADGHPTERLVSDLDKVSAESVMVLVYLTSIKLLLATVGLCIAVVVVVLPLLLVHAMLAHQRVLISPSLSAFEALCAYTALVLMFFVVVMAMDIAVQWSEAATRFFCCERVYAVPLPSARVPTARPPNVVVIRLPPSASGVYAFASSSATAPPSRSS
jgi:hypothetical protein